MRSKLFAIWFLVALVMGLFCSTHAMAEMKHDIFAGEETAEVTTSTDSNRDELLTVTTPGPKPQDIFIEEACPGGICPVPDATADTVPLQSLPMYYPPAFSPSAVYWQSPMEVGSYQGCGCGCANCTCGSGTANFQRTSNRVVTYYTYPSYTVSNDRWYLGKRLRQQNGILRRIFGRCR